MATAITPGTAIEFPIAIDFAADLDAQVGAVLGVEPAATAARVKVVLWGAPGSPVQDQPPKAGATYELILAAIKRARGDAPAPKATKAAKATKKAPGGATKGTTKGVQNLIERQKENALLAAWAAQGSPEGEWMASGQTYMGRPPTPLKDAHDQEVANRKTTTRKALTKAVAEKTAGKTTAAEDKADDKVIDLAQSQTPGVSKRTAQRRAAAERKAQREAEAAKNAEQDAAEATITKVFGPADNN